MGELSSLGPISSSLIIKLQKKTLHMTSFSTFINKTHETNYIKCILGLIYHCCPLPLYKYALRLVGLGCLISNWITTCFWLQIRLWKKNSHLVFNVFVLGRKYNFEADIAESTTRGYCTSRRMNGMSEQLSSCFLTDPVLPVVFYK